MSGDAFKFSRGTKKYFVDSTVSISKLTITDNVKRKASIADTNEERCSAERVDNEILKLREFLGLGEGSNLRRITYPGYERIWITPEKVFSHDIFTLNYLMRFEGGTLIRRKKNSLIQSYIYVGVGDPSYRVFR